MKRRRFLLMLTMVMAVLLYWIPKVDAESGFFSSHCTTSGCHASSPSTCDGCHAHGVHSSSSKNNINVAGALNKTTYAPGETVSVTIDGGYRNGWVRAILYDQNMNVLARSTAAGSKGGGPAFPLTLTAPAPSTPGAYTWHVSWFGNKYDKSSALFQPTCSATVTTNCWKPVAIPANHGEEIRSIAAFTVSSPADTTAPVVTAFSIPSTSSSLSVPITTLTATDAGGVTGYLVNESSVKPSASATGWSATKPASYACGSAGTKTLYGWAKDAAGNVSNSLSAGVMITLTSGDTIPPSITSFNLPAVSSTSKIAITDFTAADNVAVIGYMVKKNSTPPTIQDAGWQAVPPTFIKFGGQGVKTAYAWTKDAAGNISEPASATVAIKRTNKKTEVIPAPSSQAVFSYNAIAYPIERRDLAKAKPLAIGKGGDVLDLQASIGPFDGPVDAYITLLEPSYAGSLQPATRYYLRSDNIFVAATSVSQAWQANVTDINEHITDISVADLLPGPYILLMTITPAGSQDTYYQWVTPFVIR